MRWSIDLNLRDEGSYEKKKEERMMADEMRNIHLIIHLMIYHHLPSHLPSLT